jgi:hypothetical protein
MLPGSEMAPPAAIKLLNHAGQGAHDTLDGQADSAAPAVRQLGESVSTAEEALQAKAAPLRETRDARRMGREHARDGAAQPLKLGRCRAGIRRRDRPHHPLGARTGATA